MVPKHGIIGKRQVQSETIRKKTRARYGICRDNEKNQQGLAGISSAKKGQTLTGNISVLCSGISGYPRIGPVGKNIEELDLESSENICHY